MLYSKYEDFLSYLQNKKILITTHDLVDVDGFVSCIILKFFLNKFHIKPVTIFFSDLSKSTKNFMNNFLKEFPEFSFDYEIEVNFTEYELCLLIDTNDISQIDFNRTKAYKLEIPYILIDHHHFSEEKVKKENINSLNLIDDEVSSSAEIILDLLESQNQELTIPYKYLIVAAVLTDSGFFRYGNNNTIRKISKLIEEGVNFQRVLFMLQNDVALSEKIAIIKGLQRVKLIRKDNYLIGISKVSSFGASVASMLIKTGFDVSIVYSRKKEKKMINCRAKKSICLKTGLHLGKILEELSEYYEGNGGGHDGAASITVKADLDKFIPKFIEKIKQFL